MTFFLFIKNEYLQSVYSTLLYNKQIFEDLKETKRHVDL